MEIVFGIIAVIIVFILLTGKSRRANKMKKEIYSLVRSGQKKTILHDIFFEAALKFALESGAKLEYGQSKLDTTSVQFKMNIDGTNYFVYFAKNTDGSTYVGVDDADEMQKEFRERVSKTDSVYIDKDTAGHKPLHSLLASQAAKAINTLINSHSLAKQFVLEELDAARQGDSEAVDFVENSGFSPSEYIGAMEKTNWGDEENILENTQMQFRVFQSEVTPTDRAKFSIEVVDNVMKHWSLGKYSSERSNDYSVDVNGIDLERLRLVDVIKKQSTLADGAFASINKDLSDQISQDHPPAILMAAAYAARTAAAGLFLQGLFGREAYNAASHFFKETQRYTAQSVEFQEHAAEQACELFTSYDQRLGKKAVSLITSMVANNQAPEIYGKQRIPYETVLTAILSTIKKIENDAPF